MKRRELAFVCVVAIALAPALVALATAWSSTDYLTHGFLIPVVAGFAAAGRRDDWARLPVRGSSAGFAVVAAGFAVATLGVLTNSAALAGVGVVAAVAGVVLAMRGPAGVRTLAFPLVYLAFMIPPPAAWVEPLIEQLQGWVSTWAVALVRLAGVAVLREANVVKLPGGEALTVEEACSGITSVVTLLPLGVLLAWISERAPARRAVLLVCIVPAAILGNLVRVTLAILGASRYGAEVVTSGFVHEWAGIATYVLACSLLLGASAIMRAALREPGEGRGQGVVA